ncbi:MAG: hypothetical protein WB297_01960 [Actinomycetota bacterium]
MEAMAIPIKPGKLETWTSWCDELTGPRKVEFDDMNQRHGLTTHASWHQANPDGSDLAVVVIDGPGASGFLGKIATSDNEFDAWFRSQIEDVHPMDFSAPPPPMPVRQL